MAEDRWKFMSRKIIGNQDSPMLIRWRLIQTPLGGIYLHFISREDLDRDPHDHPWTFFTVILRGGYTERFFGDTSRHPGKYYHQTWGRGARRLFRQRSAHYITKVQPKTVTLVFVGPKTRSWGFFNPYGGWIDWREYSSSGRSVW